MNLKARPIYEVAPVGADTEIGQKYMAITTTDFLEARSLLEALLLENIDLKLELKRLQEAACAWCSPQRGPL